MLNQKETTGANEIAHPRELISAAEITAAVAILRAEMNLAQFQPLDAHS